MSGQSTPVQVTYKAIPGFPGYRAGDDGSIWSCWKKVGLGGRRGSKQVLSETWIEKKNTLDKFGYLFTALRREDGKRVHVFTHRLVLFAFYGPRPPGMDAAHNNGIRHDNRACNLRWDTPANNCADKKKHGTHQCGIKNAHAKLTDEDVREIRAMRQAGEKLVTIASIYGVSFSRVSSIALGQGWKHVT